MKDLTRLGNEIRAGLDALGRNQAWLAQETGLGEATISRLIHGKISKPSGHSVSAIAHALRLDPIFLQALAGLPVPAPSGVRDPSVEYIAKRLDALPEEVRELAVDAIGGVVDAFYRIQDRSHTGHGKSEPADSPHST